MNEVKALTAQEQKVVDLVSQGLTNKQVGEQLTITEKTVKFHLTNAYKKLGVKRYQLIASASQGKLSGEIQPKERTSEVLG